MARKKNYLIENHGSTPQTEPIEGTVKNSAGGYSFQVGDWARLERFLILGSEGGSYYINQAKLTRENGKAASKCIKEDGLRVLDLLLDVSFNNRAAKVDPTLFVLALASVEGDEVTRRTAFDILPQIARIGTHLFHWAEFRNALGGWGSGARRAVASWYQDKSADSLGYQLMKYKQRDGWAHLDLLRLAHVKPVDAQQSALFAYAKSKAKSTDLPQDVFALLPTQVRAAESLADSKKKDVINLIKEHRLPREVVPTELLSDPGIWEALLENMPLGAMIRNLGNMSKNGLLKANSSAARKVVAALGDTEKLQKARIHPIQVLSAFKTYSSGESLRGNGSWNPVSTVVDALDDAFYEAFKFVEPSGKRFMLGIDVSGSMSWSNCTGLEQLTCAEGAAVMAMVTAKKEPQYEILGFADGVRDLGITAKDKLDSVLRKTGIHTFGGTDCSLLFKQATKLGIDVDCFVTYTDSETYAGRSHPVQELKKYRDKTGINAKNIVVGMESNGFTIADPDDPRSLDIVGFDSSAPAVISNFARG